MHLISVKLRWKLLSAKVTTTAVSNALCGFPSRLPFLGQARSTIPSSFQEKWCWAGWGLTISSFKRGRCAAIASGGLSGRLVLVPPRLNPFDAGAYLRSLETYGTDAFVPLKAAVHQAGSDGNTGMEEFAPQKICLCLLWQGQIGGLFEYQKGV